MANTMLGGWGLFHELSNEDKAAFASGIEGFVGVSYKPVAVATQVVAGCNTSGCWLQLRLFLQCRDGLPRLSTLPSHGSHV